MRIATSEGEVLIQLGWRPGCVYEEPFSEEDTNLVFRGEIVVDGSPGYALTANLEMDDVVIFDHYQPHAFKPLTEDRKSISVFPVHSL